jgi:hypothetical protein
MLTSQSVLSTLILSLLALGFAAIEQPASQAQFTPDDLVINFQPPGGNPVGGNSDGGSRGPGEHFCDLKEPALNFTPVLPLNKYVVTSNENPKLYVYVPPTDVVGFDVELYRQTQDDWVALRTVEGLDREVIPSYYQDGGIFALDLSNFEDLEVGEVYRWKLTVNCESNGVMNYVMYPALEDPDTYIYPTIAMVEMETPPDDLQQQPSLKLASWYAQQGLWLEAVDTLAELKQTNPQDEVIEQQWNNLLTSPHAQLDALIGQPIRTIDEWAQTEPPNELDLFDDLLLDEDQPGITIEDPVIFRP